MATTNALDGVVLPITQGGTGAATTAAAQSALGGGAVGKTVFTAATTAAALDSLGGGTVGKTLFAVATTAAAQTIIGAFVSANFATTAQANAGTNDGTVMNPVLTKNAIATLGTAGYSGSGFAANNYYSGLLCGTDGATTLTVTANRLYVMPFIIGSTGAFTRIGLSVTTLSAGAARLGIYNVAAGVPTTLVQDCGTVDTGTTGAKEITITQSLTAGSYVLACVFNATPAVYRAISPNNNITGCANDFFGGTDGTFQTFAFGAYTAFAYAALPSPWAGALTQNAGVPHMFMRVV